MNEHKRSDDEQVAEQVRNLARPQADAEFRERLKREFVTGSFTERPRVIPIPSRPKHHRLRLGLSLAAAAALAILVLGINEPPRWTALPSAGTGTLVVNGVAIPVRDSNSLTRRLKAGARVRLECTQDLDLVSSGLLALQLSPKTEVVLPSPPGRWFGRTGRARVERGNLRVTTGRRFGGARLAIATPEAMVHVTGTTLAVIAEPAGTCVCVLEGTAHVGPHRGAMTRVTSGSSCQVTRGRHEARTGEMRGTERPKLLDLRDRMASVVN